MPLAAVSPLTALPPTALTIAGSDPGGGAGVQADLKTFLTHGVYGMSAIAALTAQNTLGVQGIFDVPPEFLRLQLQSIRDDLPVHAIKIGMLADAARVHAVADFLEAWPDRPPVVLDPVMVAKGGAPLLKPEAVAALRDRLAPLATLLTPNAPEAEILGLAGCRDSGLPERLRGVSLLLKGGHALQAPSGGEIVEDVLILADGVLPGSARVHIFSHPRVASKNTHGTGCTLSAAIAARLACGDDLVTACGGAIGWVAALIAGSRRSYGGGHGPLLHGLLHGELSRDRQEKPE